MEFVFVLLIIIIAALSCIIVILKNELTIQDALNGELMEKLAIAIQNLENTKTPKPRGRKPNTTKNKKENE